jgi:hypothetical protein
LVSKYHAGTITEGERQTLEELENYRREMVVTDPTTGYLVTQGEIDDRKEREIEQQLAQEENDQKRIELKKKWDEEDRIEKEKELDKLQEKFGEGNINEAEEFRLNQLLTEKDENERNSLIVQLGEKTGLPISELQGKPNEELNQMLNLIRQAEEETLKYKQESEAAEEARYLEIQKTANQVYDPKTDEMVDKQVLPDREKEEKEAAENNVDEDEENVDEEEENSSSPNDDLINLLTGLLGLSQNNNNKQREKNQISQYEYFEYCLDSANCTQSQSSGYTSKNWPNFKFAQVLKNVEYLKILEVMIPRENLINANQEPITLTEDYGLGSQVIITFFILAGVYPTNESFAASLEFQFNYQSDQFGRQYIYTCVYDTGTQLLIIKSSSTNPFSVRTTDVQVAQIIGFNVNTAIVSYDYNLQETVFGLYPMTVDFGRLFYFVNSLTLGTLTDLVLPDNGIFTDNGSSNGPQIALVPYTPNSNTGITTWIDPCPEKWFNIKNFNINSGLDFFISSSTNPMEPLNLSGRSFVLKLGLLKNSNINDVGGYVEQSFLVPFNTQKQQQQQQQQQGKYVLDSTREGYFNDDPSGYRDPWDFSNDVLERQYIPSAVAAPKTIKRRKRR